MPSPAVGLVGQSREESPESGRKHAGDWKNARFSPEKARWRVASLSSSNESNSSLDGCSYKKS